MKKNKGFTLIELLAVIIILGILLTIVGTNAIKSKKAANDNELQKQAQMLADLAAGIYSHEKIMNPTGAFMEQYNKNENFYFAQEDLIKGGYLDGKIKSPYSGNECDSAQVIFEYNSGYTYKSYLECDRKKVGTSSSGVKLGYGSDGKITTTTTP